MQAEVEHALAVVLRDPSGSVPVVVAGRTDAGVHAWGQVCSYAGEPVDVRSLNALLPDDVAAVSCSAAADGFDARRDATSRAYCYRVLTRRARPALEAGRVLWWPHRLDLSALSDCAAAVVGDHDFTAFTPTETDHVRFSRRVLGAEWRRGWAGEGFLERAVGPEGTGGGVPGGGAVEPPGGGAVEFWIEADAFMRQMIRVLVGTMLEVGSGRRSVDVFRELLDGRPRSEAGPTVAACGLYLAGVGYGGERVLRTGSAM